MHVRVLNRVWSCRRASKRNLIQQLQLELRICIVPREFRPSSIASKKIRARASLRRHPGIRCSLHPPRFLACRARSRLSSPSSCASSSTRRRSTTPWRRPRKCQRAASVRGPPLCRSRPCTRSREAAAGSPMARCGLTATFMASGSTSPRQNCSDHRCSPQEDRQPRRRRARDKRGDRCAAAPC